MKLTIPAFAVAVALTGLQTSAPALSAPIPAQQLTAAAGDAGRLTEVQFRRHGFRHHGRGGYGRRYYGPRYHGRHPYYGRPYRRSIGRGAGIAGLATGAIVGGALAAEAAQARADDRVAYCARKYKSFDPSSGTYLGYDGERHACR